MIDYLKTERIPVVSKDVLDIYPRKVCFLPRSGEAMVKRLAPTNTEALAAQGRAERAPVPSRPAARWTCSRTHPHERGTQGSRRVVVVVDDSALFVRPARRDHQPPARHAVCRRGERPVRRARDDSRTDPDVITLDVEMPRMDGIDFLDKLMRLRPMPVVMVSTLTERGAEVTLRALELGAIDFVAKPKIGVADGLRLLPTSPTRSASRRARHCAAPRRRRRAPSAARWPAPARRAIAAPVDREDRSSSAPRPAAPKRPRSCSAPAARRAGDRDHAAHAAGLHEQLRQRGWTGCAASVSRGDDGERVLPATPTSRPAACT